MILPNRIVLAVVSWMMCVKLTASQGLLQVPELSFGSSVNESNIQLYTQVVFKCVVSSAPFPIAMFIGKLKSPSQTPETTISWTSTVLRYSTSFIFSIYAQSTTEGNVVCWYKSIPNQQTSGFSNPVKLVISSLPPPKVTLQHNFFGWYHTVYCDSTAGPATNFLLSLYYRNLPVTPNTTLTHLGSLNLTGSSNSITLRQKLVNFQVEYVCRMEMLYKGKVLRSPLSNFEPAIPGPAPPYQFERSQRFIGWELYDEFDPIMWCSILALCAWADHDRTYGTLEVPELSFGSSVNESTIQLYTKVVFKCVIPSVSFPISIFIGKLESPSQTPNTTVPLVTSNVSRYWTHAFFFVNAQSTTEGDVVCWYKSTSNGQTSGFTSLPPPKLTLHPKLFMFGGNYTVYCDSTADKATNFSMSLYYRTLPVTPNTTFIHLRSLNLTETTNRILYTQKNVNFQVEYVCTMEMLYNGKVLRSPLSNFEAAIPEELPIQLRSNGHAGGCLGSLNIKLRDKWEAVCQEAITTTSSSAAAATAVVACRELGCGDVVGWTREEDIYMSGPSVGGVRCNGSENKIRDCPLDDIEFCSDINTLRIACSDALPPPKLSVVTHGPVSKLYVTEKQSVEISCSFNSPFLKSYETGQMVFRHNGSFFSNLYTRPNSNSQWTIDAPVPEGEYDCVFKIDRTFLSQPSNPVSIYIYNPPDPVPIVAGVLTSAVGAAILIYLCVFRATKAIESNNIALETRRQPTPIQHSQ